jgi:hypothetical protein
LGRTEGAVKQLQFRGLQNLREQIEVKRGKPQRTRSYTKENTKGNTKPGGKDA